MEAYSIWLDHEALVGPDFMVRIRRVRSDLGLHMRLNILSTSGRAEF